MTKAPDQKACVAIRDGDVRIRAFLLAFYDNLMIIGDAMNCSTVLVHLRITNAVVKGFKVS